MNKRLTAVGRLREGNSVYEVDSGWGLGLWDGVSRFDNAADAWAALYGHCEERARVAEECVDQAKIVCWARPSRNGRRHNGPLPCFSHGFRGCDESIRK